MTIVGLILIIVICITLLKDDNDDHFNPPNAGLGIF